MQIMANQLFTLHSGGSLALPIPILQGHQKFQETALAEQYYFRKWILKLAKFTKLQHSKAEPQSWSLQSMLQHITATSPNRQNAIQRQEWAVVVYALKSCGLHRIQESKKDVTRFRHTWQWRNSKLWTAVCHSYDICTTASAIATMRDGTRAQACRLSQMHSLDIAV